MKKLESTFINMVLALFGVTLVSSSALGFIYQITKDPIAQAQRNAKIAAIKVVLPEFDNNPIAESYKVPSDLDSLVFYPAKKNNTLAGVAVETYTNKAFSSTFKIMIGFLPDGTIHDISVLEHQETPGLGDKIRKDKSLDKETGLSWSSQFIGKHPETFNLAVQKDGGDVDAITAATISSRAFCDAVARAYNSLKKTNSRSGVVSKNEKK